MVQNQQNIINLELFANMTYVKVKTLTMHKNKHCDRPATRAELLDEFVLHHDALSMDDLNKLGYGGNIPTALTCCEKRTGRLIIQVTPRTWSIK